MNFMLFTVLAFACLFQLGSAGIGTAYTRWGRTVCPAGAYRVYKGFVAGAWYGHAGSGSNYLCVHEAPQAGPGNIDGMQNDAAWVYGAEYQLSDGYWLTAKPFSFANNGGQNLHDNNVPCVVCYVNDRTTTIVVPGRRDCGSSDLNVEYTGYMVAQYKDWGGKTEFVCLDDVPEPIQGGEANQDGTLMYPAQLACGSLPCPPYVNGMELSCSVCTL